MPKQSKMRQNVYKSIIRFCFLVFVCLFFTGFVVVVVVVVVVVCSFSSLIQLLLGVDLVLKCVYYTQ